MMFGSWNLLWCSVIYLSKVTCSPGIVIEIEEDYRRPVWNIAHMVNALYQVDYYLDQGANSLEFDITFDGRGTAQYTYHGIPCDCFRSCLHYEDLIKYLRYMRKLTTPGDPQYRPQLVMLFMDMKVKSLSHAAKIRAGEDIAEKLLDHYWLRGSSAANAYVLVSVPSIDHMDFVRSFRNKLRSENFTQYDSKIGFDFSGNEDLDSIHHSFASEDIKDNIWQGDGITNCLPRGTGRLREALRRRDEPKGAFIDKVYWWTVDRMSTMRATLRMGIDGMITNYPDRLISILHEEEFSRQFRMATQEDNPWAKYSSGIAKYESFPRHTRSENSTEVLAYEEELLYNC